MRADGFTGFMQAARRCKGVENSPPTVVGDVALDSLDERRREVFTDA
jgi:hypothetical protein